MLKPYLIKSFLFILVLISPVSVFSADETYNSVLNNLTKPESPESYYLVKDTVWGEKECVVDSGEKKIKPGESTLLKIKKECKWGGVRYKIFKASNDQNMGYLGHSFREGSFSIDITAPCKGSDCNFYDLNPNQRKRE